MSLIPHRRFETERLVLRALDLEDAQDIFDAYAQDEEVTKFMAWTPHKNLRRREISSGDV